MRIGICDSDWRYVQWLTGLVRQIECTRESLIVTYCKPSWLVEDVCTNTESFDILIISQNLEHECGVDIILKVRAENRKRAALPGAHIMKVEEKCRL